MKYCLTLSFLFSSFLLLGQFGTASDFIVTDIDGNEHHLYQILDEGKPVILDVSATWCGPCWTLHQTHALEDLHVNYGPGGTDQIRVLFYEGDPSTSLNALMGIGPGTLGNWLEGASYPFINESPLSLDLQLYAPLGFPTVNLIRPSDREIVADMYNYTLNRMIDAINEIVMLGNPTSTDELNSDVALSTYPNPVVDRLYFSIERDFSIENVSISSQNGQIILEASPSDIKNGIDVSNLNSGQYLATITTTDKQMKTLKFVKF